MDLAFVEQLMTFFGGGFIGLLIGILIGAQSAYHSPEDLKETEDRARYHVSGGIDLP